MFILSSFKCLQVPDKSFNFFQSHFKPSIMMNNSLFLLIILLLTTNIATSFTINCRFENASLSIIGTVYGCTTNSLPPTSPDPSITEVTGTHPIGRTNDDVEALTINGDNRLAFVPRASTTFFPNLMVYRLFFATGLEVLHGDEFDDIPLLRYLDIWESSLVTIASRLFEATPAVTVVWFSSNRIERVGHELFTPLNRTLLGRKSSWNQRFDREPQGALSF
jgi:hypothetical protein